MPNPSDRDRVTHIAQSAERAAALLIGKTKEDLVDDDVLVLALTRLLEIVCEAAANVTPGVRLSNPQIPWQDMIATRNRVVHAYWDIDLDYLWDIITVDLPPAMPALQELAKQLEP